MTYKIDLDYDTCDSITIHSLKEAYRLNCIPQKIEHSDEEPWIDHEFLKAIDLVMEYFCNAEQMKQWQKEKEELK